MNTETQFGALDVLLLAKVKLIIYKVEREMTRCLMLKRKIF